MNKFFATICIPMVMFLHFEASFISHSTLGLIYVLGTIKRED
jgi:hypothetical protein